MIKLMILIKGNRSILLDELNYEKINKRGHSMYTVKKNIKTV